MNCRSRNSWLRGGREHVGPRSRRSFPPGSLGEPAVVAGKLAHVFQYALNAPLGSDLHGPLTEFLSDGISLLETDLLEISDTGKESVDDIAVFKERYRFAFPTEPPPLNLS